MRILGVRLRVLAAAVLPVTLVAGLLSALVFAGRLGELDADHRARALATARQVAATSEFGLFTGNEGVLQALAQSVAREPGVESVTLLRRDGSVAAHAGSGDARALPLPARPQDSHEAVIEGTRVVVEPVLPTEVPLDQWLEPGFSTAGNTDAGVLGYAAVRMSLAPIRESERRLLIGGLVVTLAGVVLGCLLAVRIERSQEALERRIATATAELRAKKEEAEFAALAKSRFLAFASHDLRQPMHALGLFVARLEQLAREPEMQRLVGKLDASVRAMRDLLDALLDISRLDAGAETPKVEPVSVAALFDHLEREFASAAEQKGIALRVRPSEMWVRSDPRLLHRMLLNLVSNAIRYTRHGGVLVSCRRRNGAALLEVRDTGIGIPADRHKEVFREFVQLDNPERDRARGLGLGLTIVERSARLLGHPLTLSSIPGRGSCFRIEVPVAPGPAAGLAPAAAPVASDLRGLPVLVVDDDALARGAIAELLESWGCSVHAAADADEALRMAKNGGAPRVIACDYRLPHGETAVSLVTRLREALEAPIPAFVLSGDTDAEVMRAVEKEGLALLHKPVPPARLRALVQRLARQAAAS